jgi:hypothetical protein
MGLGIVHGCGGGDFLQLELILLRDAGQREPLPLSEKAILFIKNLLIN